MWAKAIVIALLMTVGTVAHAQPVPTVPALPSPTYIPTVTPQPTFSSDLPRGETYNYLATAAANVNALPDDVSAPGGAALLPNDDGRQLFAYAKWIFSTQSVREIVGPTLAPLGISAFVWVVLVLILVTIYLTIRLVITIVRFIAWTINFVRSLIPFL